MKIKKNSEKFIIIPELLSLTTNVDFIFLFYLGSSLFKLPEEKTKLNFSYVVKNNIEKPLELNTRFDYFWGRENDKRIYYEHPFFGKIKLKMLIEKEGDNFNFLVDKFYYKYIKFVAGRVWPSGLHLQNAVTLSLSSLGFTVMYGACISKKDEGTLLLASTKMGKSSTALSAIEKGYKILAEDYLVLDSKECFSVPLMPSYFLKYHSTKNWLKKIFYKILLKFPFLQMLFLYFMPLSFFISAKPSNAFSDNTDLIKKVKIEKICIFERGKTGIEELTPEKALKKIAALNRANSFYGNDSLLRAFSYFNLEINIETINSIEEKNLYSIVKQSKCYLLRAEDSKEYINLLENI